MFFGGLGVGDANPGSVGLFGGGCDTVSFTVRVGLRFARVRKDLHI